MLDKLPHQTVAELVVSRQCRLAYRLGKLKLGLMSAVVRLKASLAEHEFRSYCAVRQTLHRILLELENRCVCVLKVVPLVAALIRVLI